MRDQARGGELPPNPVEALAITLAAARSSDTSLCSVAQHGSSCLPLAAFSTASAGAACAGPGGRPSQAAPDIHAANLHFRCPLVFPLCCPGLLDGVATSLLPSRSRPRLRPVGLPFRFKRMPPPFAAPDGCHAMKMNVDPGGLRSSPLTRGEPRPEIAPEMISPTLCRTWNAADANVVLGRGRCCGTTARQWPGKNNRDRDRRQLHAGFSRP